MANFVIFGREPGSPLMWSGEYVSPRAALADFNSVVGIDPKSEGLDAFAEQYDVQEVTFDQRRAVELWWVNGGAAGDFPL